MRGDRLPTDPANWPLLNNYYVERLDSLRNIERFSETRNTDSLRTILQGAVWTVPRTVNAVAPTADQRCSPVQLGSSGAGVLAKNAYFVERAGVGNRRGLIVAVGTAEANTLNSVTSVSVGRFDAGHCVIEQQLLSTPPLRPVRVGIDADASNIVIAFSGYTQFYTVMWDAPTSVYAPLRAIASTNLIDDFRDGRLQSSSQLFWTDVALGSTTVRLFNVKEPSEITDAVADTGQPLKPLKTADAAAVCGDFAKTHGIDLKNEALWWELLAPDSDGANGRVYCLRVTSVKDSANSKLYSASLYGLSATAAAGAKEKDLPLINQLRLGASAPVQFRLNHRSGWMAFSDGRAWRAVPWSLDAFRAMASEVFKAENADKPQGCGRLDDDPQFNLPYNLILGDMICPRDAALKAASIAPAVAGTANGATAGP